MNLITYIIFMRKIKNINYIYQFLTFKMILIKQNKHVYIK